MDGPALEHSDSDSGDSWTLLDNSTDDHTIFTKSQMVKNHTDNQDKDEDTDGISIISDSEPDTPTFCEINTANSDFEEVPPVEQETPEYVPMDPQPSTNIFSHAESESMLVKDDFLGEKRKHKIYVHRRNKKISTVLNIIMLGSIITAAGVAFGHMWGARNDCSTNTIPSVNKILSNLYKLQEENAYLRNKLKELTSLNNLGYLQKNSIKQNKCKKVFEESLQNNNNVKTLIKCVDDKSNSINKFMENKFVEPAFEKEFIADVDKLKTVYLQNKSLLDDQINQRFKRETDAIKKMKNSRYFLKLNEIREEHKSQESLPTVVEPKNVLSYENLSDESVHYKTNLLNKFQGQDVQFRKISYADSLKSNNKNKVIEKDNNYNHESKAKPRHKKLKDPIDNGVNKSVSEEDFQKDNRYTGQKHKHDRQKHDRQKSHKKQKRRNKYEQWEMKGGFMKDYDEFSVLSSNENDFNQNKIDRKNKVIDNVNFSSNAKVLVKDDQKVLPSLKQENANKASRKLNWYEERAFLRNEARNKIEHELFGESSPNTAGWYFRRMHKREQCRAKADNTTYRKMPKQHMNFKMKH